MRLVSQRQNPRLRVAGVVVCMFDAQTTHAQEVVEDLRRFFASQAAAGAPWSGGRVFDPPVRRNIKLAECPSYGQTIFDYAPQAPGAADYRDLARQFLAAAPAPGPAPSEPPVVEVPAAAAQGVA